MTPDRRDQGQWNGEQRDGERRKSDHTRLGIWLTFAGTVLAALIGGVFALIAAGGDKSDVAATHGPPQSPERTIAVTEPTATRPPAGTPPAASADGGTPVRWSGRVVASTAGLSDAVDLDLRPPRSTDDTAAEGDLSVDNLGAGQVDLRKSALGLPSSFALWDGAGTPGFAQCQEAALAQGVPKLSDVETGAVLCVHTNKDRFARLTVQKINARQGTVTFDSVIWDNA